MSWHNTSEVLEISNLKQKPRGSIARNYSNTLAVMISQVLSNSRFPAVFCSTAPSNLSPLPYWIIADISWLGLPF